MHKIISVYFLKPPLENSKGFSLIIYDWHNISIG